MILRSPVAHGVIRSIDTTRRARMPGVRAVVTGDGFRRTVRRHSDRAERMAAGARTRALPRRTGRGGRGGRRRDCGERRWRAIAFDIEPLPAYFNAADARAERRGAACTTNKPGNVEREVDQDVRRRRRRLRSEPTWCANRRFTTPKSRTARSSCNAALASWEPERERLTMQSTTQVPYYLHLTLARCLGIDGAQVRVIKPFVGGGFGHRVEPLNFEMIAAAARARRRRPSCASSSRARIASSRTAAARKPTSA